MEGPDKSSEELRNGNPLGEDQTMGRIFNSCVHNSRLKQDNRLNAETAIGVNSDTGDARQSVAPWPSDAAIGNCIYDDKILDRMWGEISGVLR